MSKFILITLLLTGLLVHPQHYSSGAVLYAGKTMKMQSDFVFGDSLITFSMGGQKTNYIVTRVAAPGFIETQLGDLNIRFVINESLIKKVKGFKATHTIHVSSDQPDIYPESTYFCRIEE